MRALRLLALVASLVMTALVATPTVSAYGTVTDSPSSSNPHCIVQSVTRDRWYGYDNQDQNIYVRDDSHEHCFENFTDLDNWEANNGLTGLSTFYGQAYYAGWSVTIVTSHSSLQTFTTDVAVVPKLPDNNPFSNWANSAHYTGAYNNGCSNGYVVLRTGGSFTGDQTRIPLHVIQTEPDLGTVNDNDLDSIAYSDCGPGPIA